MQKFSDDPLSTHEKCGGPVHRLLSAPALQFKGSGWYITDYAKSSSGSQNATAKKEDSASSTTKTSEPAKTTSTTESKPNS
jgi:predicted nucleic acid-binding Zn ribbon protein